MTKSLGNWSVKEKDIEQHPIAVSVSAIEFRHAVVVSESDRNGGL
jgi:hypothetical protein